MPQNPPNITESPEFKDFCKKNNLEVFNQESINVVLFQQQEMIMEIAKNINVNKLHSPEEGCHPKYDGTETLFDKWNL